MIETTNVVCVSLNILIFFSLVVDIRQELCLNKIDVFVITINRIFIYKIASIRKKRILSQTDIVNVYTECLSVT